MLRVFNSKERFARKYEQYINRKDEKAKKYCLLMGRFVPNIDGHKGVIWNGDTYLLIEDNSPINPITFELLSLRIISEDSFKTLCDSYITENSPYTDGKQLIAVLEKAGLLATTYAFSYKEAMISLMKQVRFQLDNDTELRSKYAEMVKLLTLKSGGTINDAKLTFPLLMDTFEPPYIKVVIEAIYDYNTKYVNNAIEIANKKQIQLPKPPEILFPDAEAIYNEAVSLCNAFAGKKMVTYDEVLLGLAMLFNNNYIYTSKKYYDEKYDSLIAYEDGIHILEKNLI